MLPILRTLALASLCASVLIGGAPPTIKPPTGAVISEAPLCVRVLPSGEMVEGPEVCAPASVPAEGVE